jgi:MFS family permease
MIGVLFAASMLVTPLYVIYQREFQFSKITLTLIYAVYVVGNFISLVWLARLSDTVGRRRAAVPAIALAIASTMVFLSAGGTAAPLLQRPCWSLRRPWSVLMTTGTERPGLMRAELGNSGASIMACAAVN